MKKTYKLAITTVAIICIIYIVQLQLTSVSTPEQIKGSQLTSAKVTGEITNIDFDSGALVVVLDNILTLRMAMSTENSEKIISGEYTTLTASIEKISNNWIITEIHGV